MEGMEGVPVTDQGEAIGQSEIHAGTILLALRTRGK
jgi:hypothetical protein